MNTQANQTAGRVALVVATPPYLPAAAAGALPADVLDRRLGELSGGEVTQLGLARLLIQRAVAGGISAPKPAVETTAKWILERRDVAWRELTADMLPAPIAAPDEETLKAWHSANADRFTAPETRAITYAWVTPDMLSSEVQLDEAALRDTYQLNIDQFQRPARRMVSRLVFPDEAQAQAAREQIDANKAEIRKTFDRFLRFGDGAGEAVRAAFRVAFFAAAGLFVLLGAEFVAMLMLIVYVGAVAVLVAVGVAVDVRADALQARVGGVGQVHGQHRQRMKLVQQQTHEAAVARLGGDEFVLLLPALSISPPQAEMQADLIAERLIGEIAAPYDFRGQVLHIGASVGITLFPGREQEAGDLLKQADTAMYQAKSAGRKTRRFFDASMQLQADRRLHIHNELRSALDNGELTLHYQPQHMVAGGEIIGVEALIRWQPPGRALVSPAEFIPIAEETDLIVDIGNWVLHEACTQYVSWEENGIHVPQLSVNVSAKQFHAPDFVDRIHDVLAATGMDPACLNLEITESVVLGHAEDTISKMAELKTLGISFAIDDFGAGYSSLSYLKRLPADELKIDRSFIQDIPKDGDNMAIVEAVIAMARHMGFNVTAEGVESRQQLEFLQAQGCHFFQGYLASKPLPVPYLERYVSRQVRGDRPVCTDKNSVA